MSAPPPPPSARTVRRRVLPGFGLTLGISVGYLGLLVLLPLAALFIQASNQDWSRMVDTLTASRTLSALRVSFGASLAAAVVSGVFGFIVAWVLVRYRFPGRDGLDALVDLPFALPTAVAGISLAAIYGPTGPIGSVFAADGWLGRFLGAEGFPIAYTFHGIVIALVFVGVPFVVRTVQPVLEDLDPELEEAAAALGATRWQTFSRVVFPALLPALLTGFTLAFARGLGEYGSVVFIAGNLPGISEIAPVIVVTRLEQYDYAGAAALGALLLVLSLGLLLLLNGVQAWARRRIGSS